MKSLTRSIFVIAVCAVATWGIFVWGDNSEDKTTSVISVERQKNSNSPQIKPESSGGVSGNSSNKKVESAKNPEPLQKIIQRFSATLRSEEFNRAKLIERIERPNGDVDISYKIEPPTAIHMKEQDDALDIALKSSGEIDPQKLKILQLKLNFLIIDFRPSDPMQVNFSIPAADSDLITVSRFEYEEPTGVNAPPTATIKNVGTMKVNKIDEGSRYSAYLTTE